MKRFSFRLLLSHAAVILGGMLLVLLCIDRVNAAMEFIDNPITKGLLFALCAVCLLLGGGNVVRAAKARAKRLAQEGRRAPMAKNAASRRPETAAAPRPRSDTR